jgi:dihydrodipicolinate synthase/N-acetylneuraminate lyase
MARYPQAILVSCELPWDDRERLIEDLLREEVRCLRACGFKHLYVFGTAGEGYAVDTARFQQVIEIFYQETLGTDIHPMVGVIGLSTANIVERIGLAYSAGFRTFQISLPSWGALNDAEVLTFFKDVCGAFPDAQFLHYNLPRAKRLLSGADYRRVIDAVPNLVATKNTGGGLARASDLMRHAPELQHFFGEENFANGCLFGECSLLSSFGAMVPRKTWELFEAGRTLQIEKLFRLQYDFHNLLTDVFGPVLTENRIDGAYDKMIVRLGGLDAMPLRLLSPYQCFSEAEYQACQRVFTETYAEWNAQ